MTRCLALAAGQRRQTMILYSKGLLVSFAILAFATSCEDRESGSATDTSEEAALPETSPSAPDNGEVRTPGAQMNWALNDTTLSYKISYEAPSSCYSAGPISHSVTQPGNVVLIEAEIAFKDGICAQQITTLLFEAEIADVDRPFTVSAVLTDSRSGRTINLASVPE